MASHERCPLTIGEIRWNGMTGLRRDAVRSPSYRCSKRRRRARCPSCRGRTSILPGAVPTRQWRGQRAELRRTSQSVHSLGAPAIGGLHCASVQACALRDNSTEEIAPAVVVDRLSGIAGRRTKAQTISGGCFQTVSGSAWVPSLIRIDLPAGHYVPLFRRNTSEEADDSKLVTTTPAIAASGRLQAVAHDPHSNLGGVMPGAGRSPGSKLSTNRNLTQRQTN